MISTIIFYYLVVVFLNMVVRMAKGQILVTTILFSLFSSSSSACKESANPINANFEALYHEFSKYRKLVSNKTG